MRVFDAVKWTFGFLSVAVLTLNVEAVAVALRLDKLLLHPGIVGAVVNVVNHPATILVAVFVLGMLAEKGRAWVGAKVASPVTDPNDGAIHLGRRMRNCASEMQRLHRWDGIGGMEHERMEAVAELNGLMLDAERLGLEVPDAGVDIEKLTQYLVEVGNWLTRGDVDIARQRALSLSAMK